jgi:hypothetical protein
MNQLLDLLHALSLIDPAAWVALVALAALGFSAWVMRTSRR